MLFEMVEGIPGLSSIHCLRRVPHAMPEIPRSCWYIQDVTGAFKVSKKASVYVVKLGSQEGLDTLLACKHLKVSLNLQLNHSPEEEDLTQYLLLLLLLQLLAICSIKSLLAILNLHCFCSSDPERPTNYSLLIFIKMTCSRRGTACQRPDDFIYPLKIQVSGATYFSFILMEIRMALVLKTKLLY